MVIKYAGKYVNIYFIMKITFFIYLFIFFKDLHTCVLFTLVGSVSRF